VDRLNSVLAVDRARNLVTVQAGQRIDRFLKWAEANGFSMERGAPTTYGELTIGGVLATGAHGTGRNVTSNMVGSRLPVARRCICMRLLLARVSQSADQAAVLLAATWLLL
jgi:hypothetical protein